MRILIVEDDYIQAKETCSALCRGIPGAQIELISTESDFYAEFQEIEAAPPNLIIMDVMLRWADASPDIPPAPEWVMEQGFYRAGMRCVVALLSTESTRGIPIILTSVIDKEELSCELGGLPANVLIVSKSGNEEKFVRTARALLEGPPDGQNLSASFLARAWKSIEIKPAWMGLSVDFKKLFRRELPRQTRRRQLTSR